MHRLFTKYCFLILVLIISIVPLQKSLNHLEKSLTMVNQNYQTQEIDELSSIWLDEPVQLMAMGDENNQSKIISSIKYGLIVILIVFSTWYLAKNPFQGENRFLELLFIFMLVNILNFLAPKDFILTKSFIYLINILFLPMYLRILLQNKIIK